LRAWLKEKRENLALTQEEIATKSEIQRAYYTMIENGARNPSVEVAKRIANVIGVRWTIFFED
jgi:putative transcriptional regulator